MEIVEQSLRIAKLFEAEVLCELMLRYWDHPMAEDSDFRSWMVESACQALEQSANGEQLIQGLPPADMNFIAALWYAEWVNCDQNQSPDERRSGWLETVRRTLPSAFCSQDLLQ